MPTLRAAPHVILGLADPGFGGLDRLRALVAETETSSAAATGSPTTPPRDAARLIGAQGSRLIFHGSDFTADWRNASKGSSLAGHSYIALRPREGVAQGPERFQTEVKPFFSQLIFTGSPWMAMQAGGLRGDFGGSDRDAVSVQA